MSEWLEGEERKFEARRRERLLLSERMEVVHTHLKTFYDLCERVNRIRYDSLSIGRLNVECKRSRQTETKSHHSRETVDERRGIRISCPKQDETFIEVVIKKHSRSEYCFDDIPPGEFSSDVETVVIRNTCTLQELIDWREDQITQFIQWMVLESEVIKGSLPGTEIKNELATAEAKKAEAERQKEVEAAAAAEWIRRAPEREVRKQIASAEGEITANWKTIGLSLGSLAALFLLALGSSQIANQQVNTSRPSLGGCVQIILGVVGALGVIVFGLGTYAAVVIVPVVIIVQLGFIAVRKARIASLRAGLPPDQKDTE